MASVGPVQMSFFLLLFSGTVALNCEQIVEEQRKANERLRKAMAGQPQPPLRCWHSPHEIPDVDFPLGRILQLSQEDARRAVQLIIRQVFQIFLEDATRAQWDASVTSLFRRGLHQQSVRWRKCLMAKTGKEGEFEDPDVEQRLTGYFNDLHKFLKNKEYSLCAWANVRLQLNSHFMALDKLLRILQN